MIAALCGAGLGALAAYLLWASGMQRERASGAVVLVAIAAFYPAFAFELGDWTDRALHVAAFAGFTALALWGYARSAKAIALGIIGHGAFDLAAPAVSAPVPGWWPAFCAALDLVLGAALLFFWRNEART